MINCYLFLKTEGWNFVWQLSKSKKEASLVAILSLIFIQIVIFYAYSAWLSGRSEAL